MYLSQVTKYNSVGTNKYIIWLGRSYSVLSISLQIILNFNSKLSLLCI